MSTSAELRVALCDYGVGNLHSLAKALAGPATCVRIEPDAGAAADPRATDLLVLPGVGAFAAAAQRLAPIRDAIRSSTADGFPIIGICLGMQLFFDESEEGPGEGLGLIAGRVRRLRARRVPQIGWNGVEAGAREPRLFNDAPAMVYYANSYVCEPADDRCVMAWSEHDGDRFAAAVCGGPANNVVGLQFHPEKSSTAGVRFLRQLVERARGAVTR